MSKMKTHILPGERWLFAGIGLLATLSVAAIGIGRFSDAGGAPEALPSMVQSKLLVFEDEIGGDIAIRDADSLELVGSYSTGEGGFARTALRSLAYSRRLAGKGAADPFLLGLAEDGRLLLHDPATLKTIGLDAFGDDNVAQFAFLLEEAE
jgi:putative photosynthetic complex assembly protein